MNKQENPYKILEVETSATEEDIKKSYRKLAMKFHPDKNPDNPQEAEINFKKIAEAYAILSDPVKRRNYDLGVPTSFSDAFGNGFDPFSIFNSFFQNQNMDSIINDFFSHQSGDAFAGSFDDILGGPDIKFTIHTFTKMPGMDKLGDIPFFDILKKTEDTFKQKVNKHNKNIEKDVEILHENEKKVEKLEKMNEKLINRIKLLKKYKTSKKFENIEKQINVFVEDVLECKAKKIKVTRYIKKDKDSEFEEEIEKFLFNLDSDFDKLTYIFPSKGHKHYSYQEDGDLIIRVRIINNIVRYNLNNNTLFIPINYNRLKKKLEKCTSNTIKIGKYLIETQEEFGDNKIILYKGEKNLVLLLNNRLENNYKNWEIEDNTENIIKVSEIKDIENNWEIIFNFI